MISKEVIVTTHEIAELFSVTDKYVSQLVIDHGMPKLDHNSFNLFTCVKWHIEYKEKSFIKKLKEAREENTRSRKERVEAELKELELEEKKLNLLPAGPVAESKRNDAIIYSRGLEALETKLPPLIMGSTSVSEIAAIIRKETHSIRKQISELPADIHESTVAFDLS